MLHGLVYKEVTGVISISKTLNIFYFSKNVTYIIPRSNNLLTYYSLMSKRDYVIEKTQANRRGSDF